jgi:hypothetical protein
MRLTGQEGKNSAQIRAVVEEASAGVRIRRRVRRWFVECMVIVIESSTAGRETTCTKA